MISEIILTLALIRSVSHDADMVLRLVSDLLRLLKPKDDNIKNFEAVHEMAAGIAAARANAIQEYARKRPKVGEDAITPKVEKV